MLGMAHAVTKDALKCATCMAKLHKMQYASCKGGWCDRGMEQQAQHEAVDNKRREPGGVLLASVPCVLLLMLFEIPAWEETVSPVSH